MGGWVRVERNIDKKTREEENRERKQKSQPTRSKSGTKYTACSLDSVFLQKEKEDGIVVSGEIALFAEISLLASSMGDLCQNKRNSWRLQRLTLWDVEAVLDVSSEKRKVTLQNYLKGYAIKE